MNYKCNKTLYGIASNKLRFTRGNVYKYDEASGAMGPCDDQEGLRGLSGNSVKTGYLKISQINWLKHFTKLDMLPIAWTRLKQIL